MKKDNQNKVKQLEKEIAEITAGWQRTQADFVNYKKQVAAEKLSLISSSNANLVYDILPILDNFKLAADHVPADLCDNNWVSGVKQIERQLEQILESEGLTKIPALGCQFNPEFHDAIEEVKSDKDEGTIVAEILPGYKFDEKVIRPAKVKVAKK